MSEIIYLGEVCLVGWERLLGPRRVGTVNCGFLTGTRLSYSGKYRLVSVVSLQEWSHIIVQCSYQLCISV